MKTSALCVLACVLLVVGCGGDEPTSANVAPYDDDDAALPLLPVVSADAGVQVDAAVLAPVDGRSYVAIEVVHAQDAAAPLAPLADAAAAPAPCLVAMHLDADHDGFGVAAETMVDCANHAGYVANGNDCYDSNAKAYPSTGWREWFDVDRGDGSYDYDCDGVETPFDTKIATCPEFTSEDYHCPPNNPKLYPGMVGDSNDVHCYDAIAAKISATNEGWWGSVGKCGEVSEYGLDISYARTNSTGYLCKEPNIRGGKRQMCY